MEEKLFIMASFEIGDTWKLPELLISSINFCM